jgi:hypothetical protein
LVWLRKTVRNSSARRASRSSPGGGPGTTRIFLRIFAERGDLFPGRLRRIALLFGLIGFTQGRAFSSVAFLKKITMHAEAFNPLN